ncbi:hypothetical protein GOBAR_DD26664 [Gossypium barbadense]|nr:hypothetical protein GOBAR_DD26664 [Gossypium barbadense]
MVSSSSSSSSKTMKKKPTAANSVSDEPVRGSQLRNRPCDEIYVVGEGETLHSISDKCGDPFIVERNPHIHDPDDVFPGLVIKIIASTDRKL